jgi:hypothetical protein
MTPAPAPAEPPDARRGLVLALTTGNSHLIAEAIERAAGELCAPLA